VAAPRGAHLRIRELASPFLAKPIQTSYCGIDKFTLEPAGPCGTLHPGRWVYEKGAGRAAAGAWGQQLRYAGLPRGRGGTLAVSALSAGTVARICVAASSRAHF
jgi:hypothetical protein